MKILALDVGTVRIGVAISDDLEMGAYPLMTYTRVGALKRDLAAIQVIAAEQEADTILVGLPTSIDGGEGPQAKYTRGFGDALAKVIGVPLVYWDESMTSVEANDILIGMNYSRQKRRLVLDQWAAKLLLESYLDHRRATNARREAPG
ncbi:MAG: Holliday junction resolvase RuvX [Capsulimonadaceae bacterium]|nr:Holliday junction resolvase RuvX [Capsulimonadaceae bacterium]